RRAGRRKFTAAPDRWDGGFRRGQRDLRQGHDARLVRRARDDPPVRRRPIAQESATDDQIAADGAEIVRVPAGATVVAEHKILVRADLPGVVADGPPAEVLDIWLLEAHAVYIDPPIADGDRLAGQTDHALDEVMRRIGGVVKNDHV